MSSVPELASASEDRTFRVDFTTLQLTVTLPCDHGSDEDNSEFAFTKEYKFSVADPNPPPRAPSPKIEDQDENLDPMKRFFALSDARHKWWLANPEPESLLEIQVRTINRAKIPRGEFHSYMDNVTEDFLQFSMAVFTRNGFIKSSLRQGSPGQGTGVWDSEINRGELAYIEQFKVNPKYQRQGVGRWAIESLLTSDVLAHCPYFFTWATPINDWRYRQQSEAEFNVRKQGVISFYRAMGFRRVGGTWFFGYARNPQHPMRSLKAEDDAEETQVKGATVMDVY